MEARKIPMRVRCKWCKRKIAPCGMPRHVSALHRMMTLAEFRMHPAMITYGLASGHLPPMQLALPAPNALTVYSTRPLGRMAAPIPELRRPKGYHPPQNYARPADLLAGQVRYGYIFT
jgi:hypothetical protein